MSQGRKARIALALLSLPVVMPLLWLAAAWWQPAPGWQHLRQFVLPAALRDTGLLLLGVSLVTALLGTSLAWLTARYEFPGRRSFEWLLLLPLAMPTFVVAFIWVGLAEYSAFPSSYWRAWFGEAARLPELRGVAGGVWIFGLSLYPYVYLLARQSFAEQGDSLTASAKLLGLSALQRAWRLHLPMARPAIVLGLSLALMETLADFGAAALLGLDTLTTTVYKAWYSLYSLALAAQLASLGVLVVFLLLWLEQRSRNRLRFVVSGHAARSALRGYQASVATGFAATVVLLAFVVPALQLLRWASISGVAAGLAAPLKASLQLALASALCVLLYGALVALAERRRQRDLGLANWALLSGLGYAVPGTVLGVGLLLVVAPLDKQLDAWQLGRFALVGSVPLLLIAYVVRFARMGSGPFQARLLALSPSVPEAAQTLGLAARQRFQRLYGPLLTPAAFTASLVVFVETLKELPATLVLRPLGWDTLAVQIYSYTSEGLWQQAALPALLLVAAGLLPVILLTRVSPSARS